MSDATALTRRAVQHVGELCACIESLSFSRCYSVAPAAYLMLSSVESLRYLNLFGVLKKDPLDELDSRLPAVTVNKFPFSSVARPTVGVKRTSIWNKRVRD